MVCDSDKIIVEGGKQIYSRPAFSLAPTSKQVLSGRAWSCFKVDQLLRGHFKMFTPLVMGITKLWPHF